MHRLQCDKTLSWDKKLDREKLREWKNISLQFNKSKFITVQRSCGSKTDSYKLIGYTDASGQIYGVVIYLMNVNTGRMNLIMTKNRIVNRTLESKTIPSLELQGILLGVELLVDLKDELCGENIVQPLNIIEIKLYSDSTVCLSWINSYALKFDKFNNKSVFVKNRLEKIVKLCDKYSIQFGFCSGAINCGDVVTRVISSKQLHKSNYAFGQAELDTDLCFTLPYASQVENLVGVLEPTSSHTLKVPLICPERFSSFSKLIKTYFYVLKFINCKIRKYSPESELYCKAFTLLIKNDQQAYYGNVLNYYESKLKMLSNIPPVVSQLNVFRDEDGILRVKSKFQRWSYNRNKYPILLSKQSKITDLIILELHNKMNHANYYTILSEFRKSYYVPHCFSTL